MANDRVRSNVLHITLLFAKIQSDSDFVLLRYGINTGGTERSVPSNPQNPIAL